MVLDGRGLFRFIPGQYLEILHRNIDKMDPIFVFVTGFFFCAFCRQAFDIIINPLCNGLADLFLKQR
ncbi:hypothetical protein SDC9_203437 [bioreactor metagenome]|uniref:Uncharacterized protein n=1 Tax=bioreactor metagenome TaxID=1076179 RepID=A0A645J8D7_9ZZZZ